MLLRSIRLGIVGAVVLVIEIGVAARVIEAPPFDSVYWFVAGAVGFLSGVISNVLIELFIKK